MSITVKKVQVGDKATMFHVTRPPESLFKWQVRQIMAGWKRLFPQEYRDFFEATKAFRDMGDKALRSGVRSFGYIPARPYNAICRLVDLKDWSLDPKLMQWFFDECKDARTADGSGSISTMYDRGKA